MPSDKSLYHKLLLTLETAASDEHSSQKELESLVLAKRGASFSTSRYDEKRDEFVSRPSKQAVHRTVRLCVRLGLIGADGKVTAAGRRAATPSKFDAVVAKSVGETLERAGVTLQQLDESIKKALTLRTAEMPTAAYLWNTTKPQLTKGQFATYLTLLVHCGHADAFQKRLYLGVKSRT